MRRKIKPSFHTLSLQSGKFSNKGSRTSNPTQNQATGSICNAEAKVYREEVPQKRSEATGARRATHVQAVGIGPWKHSEPMRTQWTNSYQHTSRMIREGTSLGSNIPAVWGQKQSCAVLGSGRASSIKGHTVYREGMRDSNGKHQAEAATGRRQP